jgi:sulfite reductase (NADPH) hemoprotein beta-component/sulfite reductase (ferredoxin)
MTKKEKPDTAAHSPFQTLDLSGVQCPMNFVKVKVRLSKMEIGEQLKVILDSGEPIKNVPTSLDMEGQEILSLIEIRNGQFEMIVKKRK